MLNQHAAPFPILFWACPHSKQSEVAGCQVKADVKLLCVSQLCLLQHVANLLGDLNDNTEGTIDSSAGPE